MRFITDRPSHDLTYSDVFLVPSRSEVGSRLSVDLSPDDATGASLPIVAANMNSVTGPRLAASLARRGGLGVLPQDLDIEQLQDAIGEVKAQPVAFDSAITLPETATVHEALRILPPFAGHGIVVTRADGSFTGIHAPRLASALPDAVLRDLAHAKVPSFDISELPDARSAFNRLREAEAEFGVVTDSEGLVGTISRTSAIRRDIYAPALAADGRLKVAVAIGVNGDPRQKAKDLIAAGADVLVVDTAHGHQESMLAAVSAVAEVADGRPVVAGNVVTADGVRDLVAAGATIIKVGVGPGAMCTTRMMTAVGRPQFSAVLETAETAHELGARVWADGGVRYPRDVALALAAGASSVMVGSWFAGTIEAPGELLHDEQGRLMKLSWGMASTKAVQARFAELDPFDLARKKLFAEGISSSSILVDPLRPSLEDLLDMITSGVRSSMTYAGARDLQSFRERALVGCQSAAGYEEGKALPVSW
ncbi:GuaB1 family IMP dehydrogenase-related protein [Humidisolicoccus flavus]|uniref:GMP reductase n=1 Tax=Humidisolicoccus flavus TaxID=3111414 RepID=UPI003254E207